ncbi:hypothetical protein Ddye_005059 [Dipteronia dyeriana]|uniref:Peptidase A1 domain-containing protein n=1 Tax=Dipteronia dyeriana TaxID=168575 RepID=A0AAE0CPC7_9ROSI|nr:hypothetical protein Ddye_005059 [Dipteronia dyeriana]
MATSISFVGLSCFLLSLCLVCSVKEGYAFEELRESHAESYLTHTFEVSSLFASSICNHSTKANERKSTFRVVDKYGPCFQPNQQRSVVSPSLTDIIRSDRARIYSIHHSRLSKSSGRRDHIVEPNSLSIPVKDGSAFSTSNYLVTVGLGKPKKDLSLVLDTGSDLTWTQCQPCSRCYKQTKPLFDRTQSSTYVNISKSDSVCAYVQRPGTVPPGAETLCFYRIAYGDGSISLGFFSKETLTMSAAEKINSFLFGCGTDNRGEFDLEAGILGLSQESASIVFQTAAKYNKIFSYCIPSSASSTGHLTFGSQTPAPANIIYTKLVAQKSPSYGLDLIGIGLGGTKLNISESVFTTPGTIIDSGTVFTYLPPNAYPTFRDAFRAAMTAYPLTTGRPDDDLDTCYDLSKTSSVKVPEISFFFKDGKVVGMPGKSSLVTYSKTNSQVCLGFAPYEAGDDEIIIGNQVQRTMEVVYGVAGQRIGFALIGCT